MYSKLRKEFLDDLPIKLKSKIRGVDLALINGGIAAILDGQAKINGKVPLTRKERFIVILSYFKTVRTNLNLVFNIDIEPHYKVEIKHYEQPKKNSFIRKFAEKKSKFKHF